MLFYAFLESSHEHGHHGDDGHGHLHERGTAERVRHDGEETGVLARLAHEGGRGRGRRVGGGGDRGKGGRGVGVSAVSLLVARKGAETGGSSRAKADTGSHGLGGGGAASGHTRRGEEVSVNVVALTGGEAHDAGGVLSSTAVGGAVGSGSKGVETASGLGGHGGGVHVVLNLVSSVGAVGVGGAGSSDGHGKDTVGVGGGARGIRVRVHHVVLDGRSHSNQGKKQHFFSLYDSKKCPH